MREIAQKLGVNTILEGSVRKAGDQVRITAQLIRASDGFHLWSETYDRKLENIFAIQDDIANRIAKALQISLGVSDQRLEQSRRVNPEVYDLYLRARALHRQRGEGLLQAIALFEQALAVDPDFAPAWAGLSHTYIVLPNYISQKENQQIGDVLGKSLAAAERAIELDPNLPTAIHAMANNLLFQFEWAEAERHYLKALELDPDSTDIMEDYASLLTQSWQLNAARSMADRMIALDPYVPVFQIALIGILEAQGELDLRDEHIGIALRINPDLPNLQSLNLARLLGYGRYEEARKYASRMGTIMNSHDELQRLIGWVAENADQQPDSGLVRTLAEAPMIAMIAGRYDLWLEVVKNRGEIWPEWDLGPSIDLLSPNAAPELMHKYRSDPRTKTYLKRLRLPEYWRQVGWPDVCQPLGVDDFECH